MTSPKQQPTLSMYFWQTALPQSGFLKSSHRKIRYRLGQAIEPGGKTAAIFEATHANRRKDVPERVVIKIQIPPKKDDLATTDLKVCHDREFRMLRTVQSLGDQGGIVKLHDWGSFEHREDSSLQFRFLVLEDLRGGTLEKNLLAGEKWHFYSKLQAFYRLCATVEKLHSIHILHGNLTLTNLMLRNPGDIESLTIVDFSLAQRLQPGRQKKNGAGFPGRSGHPTRRPPEYIYPTEFPLSLKADVFSLGQVFTALLWSVKLADDIGVELETGEWFKLAPPPPEDKDLEAAYHLILRMVTANPDERPTVADVRYQIRYDYPLAFGDRTWETMTRLTQKALVSWLDDTGPIWVRRIAKLVRASLFPQSR